MWGFYLSILAEGSENFSQNHDHYFSSGKYEVNDAFRMQPMYSKWYSDFHEKQEQLKQDLPKSEENRRKIEHLILVAREFSEKNPTLQDQIQNIVSRGTVLLQASSGKGPPGIVIENLYPECPIAIYNEICQPAYDNKQKESGRQHRMMIEKGHEIYQFRLHSQLLEEVLEHLESQLFSLPGFEEEYEYSHALPTLDECFEAENYEDFFNLITAVYDYYEGDIEFYYFFESLVRDRKNIPFSWLETAFIYYYPEEKFPASFDEWKDNESVEARDIFISVNNMRQMLALRSQLDKEGIENPSILYLNVGGMTSVLSHLRKLSRMEKHNELSKVDIVGGASAGAVAATLLNISRMRNVPLQDIGQTFLDILKKNFPEYYDRAKQLKQTEHKKYKVFKMLDIFVALLDDDNQKTYPKIQKILKEFVEHSLQKDLKKMSLKEFPIPMVIFARADIQGYKSPLVLVSSPDQNAIDTISASANFKNALGQKYYQGMPVTDSWGSFSGLRDNPEGFINYFFGHR